MFTSFDVVLNPMILLAIILFSSWIGFLFKRRRIAKDRAIISKYEKEMVLDHAEILELQKDYINLEIKMRELTIPVIPFNPSHNNQGQDNERQAIDTTHRKKLLSVEGPGKERFSRENIF